MNNNVIVKGKGIIKQQISNAGIDKHNIVQKDAKKYTQPNKCIPSTSYYSHYITSTSIVQCEWCDLSFIRHVMQRNNVKLREIPQL